MQTFAAGLGVQCSYCHVANDFASDDNPKKEIARTMLRMLKQINLRFPDAGNDFLNSKYLPFPEGNTVRDVLHLSPWLSHSDFRRSRSAWTGSCAGAGGGAEPGGRRRTRCGCRW